MRGDCVPKELHAFVAMLRNHHEVWKDFVKTASDPETGTERNDRKDDYAQAALRLMTVLSEVECCAVQLERSGEAGPYHLANVAGHAEARRSTGSLAA